MSDEEDEELNELKRRRLADMSSSYYAKKAQEKQIEEEKRNILREILEPEARSRLDNLRIVRPDFTELIENQLIALYQQGRISRVTDEQLKALLYNLSARQKNSTIRIQEK
ncbi:MAG: DNA-binding protein [Thermoprotei archaeon]|jgi:programmed cell death protein 5